MKEKIQKVTAGIFDIFSLKLPSDVLVLFADQNLRLEPSIDMRMREEWPFIYDKIKQYKQRKGRSLGDIISVLECGYPSIYVLIIRDKSDKFKTNIPMLQQCADAFTHMISLPIDRVYLPFKSGCSFRGGNWDQVFDIIRTGLSNCDIHVCLPKSYKEIKNA